MASMKIKAVNFELKFREKSYAGQVWHSVTVIWDGRPMFGTGLYRDKACARLDAMTYIDVMRTQVFPATINIVSG